MDGYIGQEESQSIDIFRLSVMSKFVKSCEGVDIREDILEGRGVLLQKKG